MKSCLAPACSFPVVRSSLDLLVHAGQNPLHGQVLVAFKILEVDFGHTQKSNSFTLSPAFTEKVTHHPHSYWKHSQITRETGRSRTRLCLTDGNCHGTLKCRAHQGPASPTLACWKQQYKEGGRDHPIRWGLLTPGSESHIQPYTTASSGTAPLCTAIRKKVWVFPGLFCHCDEGTCSCGVCCAGLVGGWLGFAYAARSSC